MLIQFVIMYQEKNGLPKNGSSTHTLAGGEKPINVLFSDIPAICLKKELINGEKHADVLGELIAVTETAFAFIHYSELDLPIKNAMAQLEKQFEFCRRLLGR